MKLSSPAPNDRILIIDDNPAIHDDIRKILGDAEQPSDGLAESKALLFGEEYFPSAQKAFAIDSAYQGQEGLLMVRQAEQEGRPFAMAFVDVRMPPGWDGVETVSRIWQAYPHLQVVICTAYSDYVWSEMIQRPGQPNNLLFLKKPFDNIEVLQLAHTLTEKWAVHHDLTCRLQNLERLLRERTAELQLTNEQLRQEIARRQLLENTLRPSEKRLDCAFPAASATASTEAAASRRDASRGGNTPPNIPSIATPG